MQLRPAGSTLLAALVLATAAGTAGFLLRPAEPPPNLAAGQDPGSAPTSLESFADEHTVEVTLNTTPTLTLELGRGGRVTATECVAEAPLASGEVAVEIDGEPVLALAGSVPPHRDLGQGDRGPDVAALQSELARLGHETAEDGTYGAGTAAAVRELQQDAGISPIDGRLSVADTLWLPASEVSVDACHAPLGSTVQPGGPFAEAPGTLESVAPTAPPETVLDSERELTIGGVVGPVDAEGFGDDPDFLRELSDTEEARAAREEDGTQIMGTFALADPVDVLKVPPGALAETGDGTGCLSSDGKTHTVDIVGSSIGAALVVPAGSGDPADLPDRVDLGETAHDTCRGGNP